VLALGSLTDPAALTALLAGEPFPDLHTIEFEGVCGEAGRTAVDQLVNSDKLPRLSVLMVRFSGFDPDDDYRAFEAICRGCGRLVWAGGVMGLDPQEPWDKPVALRVAFLPDTAYLPSHLDDFNL
jgi:hypothetical protein